MTVEVVVADPNPHASLFLTVFTECNTARDPLLLEFPVMLVHEQQARSRVAGNVDVRPAVFVEVRSHHGHVVAVPCRRDARLLTYIREGSVTFVPIKRVPSRRHTPRAAVHRNSLPGAIDVGAGFRSMLQIELNVVGDEEIEVPVAIIVDKGATGAPPGVIVPESCRSGDIGKRSVAIVSIQFVLSEVGAEQILETVVVIITDRHGRCPSCRTQTRFLGNVSEGAIAVVAVEAACRSLRNTAQSVAVQNENVHPTVVVVVEEGTAAAHR